MRKYVRDFGETMDSIIAFIGEMQLWHSTEYITNGQKTMDFLPQYNISF